jgi:hypothetical protein
MLHLLWERGCVIVSDIDHCVVIKKLLDYILNILQLFIRQWEIRYTYKEMFFRKVAYTRYDATWFVE